MTPSMARAELTTPAPAASASKQPPANAKRQPAYRSGTSRRIDQPPAQRQTDSEFQRLLWTRTSPEIKRATRDLILDASWCDPARPQFEVASILAIECLPVSPRDRNGIVGRSLPEPTRDRYAVQ